MAALVEASRAPGYPAEIVLIVSNRPDARGLLYASEAGIRSVVVDHTSFPDRTSFEEALGTQLNEARVDLVCLAGFMRVLSREFVHRWHGRLINIHPSLLPAFPGLNTHANALLAGAREHGCTVHFVAAEIDGGPVIAQAEVPVLPSDSPDSLAARVLAAEHRLYPRALAEVASGRTSIETLALE
jgi:phosphoribosylglycinamide formyltransferase 1